jgi:hypothetical protein
MSDLEFNFKFTRGLRDGVLNHETKQKTRLIMIICFIGIIITLSGPLVGIACWSLETNFPDFVLNWCIHPNILGIVGIIILIFGLSLTCTLPTDQYEIPKMTSEDIENEKRRWLKELREQANAFAEQHKAKLIFSSAFKETVAASVIFIFTVKKSESLNSTFEYTQEFSFEYY